MHDRRPEARTRTQLLHLPVQADAGILRVDNQRHITQFANGNPAGTRQRMLRRHRRHQRRRLPFLNLDANGHAQIGLAQHAEIQHACVDRIHLVSGRHLPQPQLHRGMALAVAAQRGRQPHRQHRRRRKANVQLAELARGRALHLVSRELDRRENTARLDQEMAPRLREMHAPLVTLEQRHAELLLQRADLGAQRRLRDVKSLSRAREAKLLGNGDEVSEMTQFHDTFKVLIFILIKYFQI